MIFREDIIAEENQINIHMSQTEVVNCKGCVENVDDYVYIGRPSKWGNPFQIGKDGSRVEVIKKYREWLKTQPELLDCLGELKGKKLGCWCAPNKCHGDILKELVDYLNYE